MPNELTRERIERIKDGATGFGFRPKTEWDEIAALCDLALDGLRLRRAILQIQALAVPAGSDYGNGDIAAICKKALEGNAQ